MKMCNLGAGLGIGLGFGFVFGLALANFVFTDMKLGMTPEFAVLLITFGLGGAFALAVQVAREAMEKRRRLSEKPTP